MCWKRGNSDAPWLAASMRWHTFSPLCVYFFNEYNGDLLVIPKSENLSKTNSTHILVDSTKLFWSHLSYSSNNLFVPSKMSFIPSQHGFENKNSNTHFEKYHYLVIDVRWFDRSMQIFFCKLIKNQSRSGKASTNRESPKSYSLNYDFSATDTQEPLSVYFHITPISLESLGNGKTDQLNWHAIHHFYNCGFDLPRVWLLCHPTYRTKIADRKADGWYI